MISKLSPAEQLFVDIFTSIYGEEYRDYLLKYHNLQFQDSEGRNRYHDFVLFLPNKKIAIEIEGEKYHNPYIVGENKYSDDLLRANAQILSGYVRLSFTPKNLFENVSIVKKQLREALGDNPELIMENVYKENDIKKIRLISSNKAIPNPVGSDDQVAFGDYRVQEYAKKHMLSAFKTKEPASSDLINYSVARNVGVMANEFLKPEGQYYIDQSDIKEAVETFIEEFSNDNMHFHKYIIKLVKWFEEFNTANIEEFHKNQVH